MERGGFLVVFFSAESRNMIIFLANLGRIEPKYELFEYLIFMRNRFNIRSYLLTRTFRLMINCDLDMRKRRDTRKEERDNN